MREVKFRAEQFDGSNEMIYKYYIDYDRAYSLTFRIKTSAGWLGMKVGDWIVTSVKGERWVIADDVFKASYVEVD